MLRDSRSFTEQPLVVTEMARSFDFIDLTGEDDHIRIPRPSPNPVREEQNGTSPSRHPITSRSSVAEIFTPPHKEEQARSHDSGIGESFSGSQNSLGNQKGLQDEGQRYTGLQVDTPNNADSHTDYPTVEPRRASPAMSPGGQALGPSSKRRKIGSEAPAGHGYSNGFTPINQYQDGQSELRTGAISHTSSTVKPTPKTTSMTLHFPRAGSSKTTSFSGVPPLNRTSNPTSRERNASFPISSGDKQSESALSTPRLQTPSVLANLHPAFNQPQSSPTHVAPVPIPNLSSQSAFPPDFDRGRFPALRRRRGGAKYGTPRKNGFPKLQPEPVLENRGRHRPASLNRPNFMKSTPKQARDTPSPQSQYHYVTTNESSDAVFRVGKPDNLEQDRKGGHGSHEDLDNSSDLAIKMVAEVMARQRFVLTEHEREALTTCLYRTIIPSIKRQRQRQSHHQPLSEDEFVAIDRSVMNDLVDQSFINSFRENDLDFDRQQRNAIKKQISRLYAVKVQQVVQSLSTGRAWPVADSNNVSASKTLRENSPCSKVTPSRSSEQTITPSPGLDPHSSQSETDVKMELYPGIVRGRATESLSRPIGPTDGAERELTRRGVPSPINPLGTCRSKTKTQFDPHLELTVSKLTQDEAQSPRRYKNKKNFITEADQEKVADGDSVVKQVNSVNFSLLKGRIADPVLRPERSVSSLLRHRELGSNSRGRNVETHSELRLQTVKELRPWRNWKGASSDIVTVAWAPDSMTYAVGAAAHTNMEDLQYNRPCNLLLGELSSNKIQELPDHRVDRPKPDTINAGPNSSLETYNACDPNVYQTVSSVGFSISGDLMYSASRDHTVKVWNVSNAECIATLQHDENVTCMEVSSHFPGVFATASHSLKNSIRVYFPTESQEIVSSPMLLSSSRAKAKPKWEIYPECIRWGSSVHTSNYLLAGFSQWAELGSDLCREGNLCVWDLKAEQPVVKVWPSSQSVYTAAWHPFDRLFATAGAPGSGQLADGRNTKTVLRTWDIRNPARYAMEYECTAPDMTDITFHPRNSNFVTAGCTDGTTFVWDYRWPYQPLHRLRHGTPLNELDHNKPRAEADSGVCLSLWGPEGSTYYSGSSDGIVKAWDIRRHPADVLIKNVAQVGAAIQNGAFSPDFTNLLLGDAAGGIHILSSAPYGMDSPPTHDSIDSEPAEVPIELIRAPDGSGKSLPSEATNPGTEGILAARELVSTSQLSLHPIYGPGQGPEYRGPYASHARKENHEDGELREENAERIRALNGERKAVLASSAHRYGMGDGGDDKGKGKGKETVRGQGRSMALHKDVPEADMVEENFWWSRLGEEEIERARRACLGEG